MRYAPPVRLRLRAGYAYDRAQEALGIGFLSFEFLPSEFLARLQDYLFCNDMTVSTQLETQN